MNNSLFRYVDSQLKADSNIPRIKINLYHGYEVEAVAQAANAVKSKGLNCRIECVMVSDSYLMTHLGKTSTSLTSLEEEAEFLDTMVSLTAEVKNAVDRFFPEDERPFILGDLPSNSSGDIKDDLKAAVRMMDAGAQAIKLEMFHPDRFKIAKMFSSHNIPVVCHLGYTPQNGENKSYGNDFQSVCDLFSQAQMARDAGAIGLVIERVNEFVNQYLCVPSVDSLPVYSIFSGRASFGGQSLNVWDSVIHMEQKNSFFPPTSIISRDKYETDYTIENISGCMENLIEMTIKGEYPKSPVSRISNDDVNRIKALEPWGNHVDPVSTAVEAV